MTRRRLAVLPAAVRSRPPRWRRPRPPTRGAGSPSAHAVPRQAEPVASSATRQRLCGGGDASGAARAGREPYEPTSTTSANSPIAPRAKPARRSAAPGPTRPGGRRRAAERRDRDREDQHERLRRARRAASGGPRRPAGRRVNPRLTRVGASSDSLAWRLTAWPTKNSATRAAAPPIAGASTALEVGGLGDGVRLVRWHQRVADHQLVEAWPSRSTRPSTSPSRSHTAMPAYMLGTSDRSRARKPGRVREGGPGDGLTEGQQLGRGADDARDRHRDEPVVCSAKRTPHPVAGSTPGGPPPAPRPSPRGKRPGGEAAGHDDRVTGRGGLGCRIVERDGPRENDRRSADPGSGRGRACDRRIERPHAPGGRPG